jgi:hypothetical protein
MDIKDLQPEENNESEVGKLRTAEILEDIIVSLEKKMTVI